MKLGQTLLQKPIYSLSDGKLLGTVKDIYLDYALTTITGLMLASDKFFKLSSAVKVIPMQVIRQFGVDVIFVTHSEVMTSFDETAGSGGWVRREELKGREITSPNATKVGKIGDIMFDDQGRIISFSLAEVYVTGSIAMQQAVRRDVVINAGDNINPMLIDLVKAGQPSLL